MSANINLVLVRHGESLWNRENRFTGWTDVELSNSGVEEAKAAGQLLLKEGFQFSMCHTSYLKRAIRTLWLILGELDAYWLPQKTDWRLNERHYGNLQGLDKKETTAKYGEAQVFQWRRSYDIPPPLLNLEDPRHPRFEKKYAGLGEMPNGESLKDTERRVQNWWLEVGVPSLAATDQSVLVVAHGNSIRALVKNLSQVSESEIAELNIPTGIPMLYTFEKRELSQFKANSSLASRAFRYLGDQEAAKSKAAQVANQAKN